MEFVRSESYLKRLEESRAANGPTSNTASGQQNPIKTVGNSLQENTENVQSFTETCSGSVTDEDIVKLRAAEKPKVGKAISEDT